MYSTVPTTAPAIVVENFAADLAKCLGNPSTTVAAADGAPDERAIPKSMIIASSSAPIMMLAGLRSRWTTLAVCAATSPETMPRAMRRIFGMGRRPSLLETVARSAPSTYGIVMYLMPQHLADVVNAHDVLVRDLAREQQLALEAPLDFSRRGRIGHHLGANHLDRDDDAELRVPRLIHGAHAADAEQPDDVISRAERRPNFEGALFG